jgi:hypothetical protein
MRSASRSSLNASSPVIGGPRNGLAVPRFRTLEWFEDFIAFAKGSSLGSSAWYDAGSGAGSTLAVDGHGGIQALTTGTGTGHYEGFASGREFYSFSADRQMYVEARIKADSDALTARAIWLGFTEGTVQGDDNGTILTPLSHVGLSILGADVSLSHAGSTAQTVDTGHDMVADAWTVLAVHYDGKDTYRAYVDGVLKAVDRTAGTTNPAELMRVLFAVDNSGESGAAVVQLDYIYINVEL